MATRATAEMLGKAVAQDILQRRVIQVWSVLHGMISLHNSQVVGYVVPDPKAVYERTLDELVALAATMLG